MSPDDSDRRTDELIERSLRALRSSVAETPADELTTERFRNAVRRVRTDPAEDARIESLATEFEPMGYTDFRSFAAPTPLRVPAALAVESVMVEDADAVGSAALTRATSTSTATSTVTAASTSTATATRAPMVALATSPDSLPQAPPGTILVMGPDGGYAVPPRRFTLLFGRDREDVHVPVGVTDPYVSRRQGVFTCSGQDGGWWLSNTGNLPIEMPGGVLLLRGHRRLIEPGYTSLFIHTPRGHHFLEVRVVGHLDEPHREAATPTEPERDPDTYELTPSERLVLTALAERYLQGQDQYPLPRTWEETARLVNGSHRTTKTWTFKSVAYVVESVRVRLHDRGVRGLMRDEVGEPVGTSLSANLIRELLRTATLTPDDLELLDQTM